MPRATIQYGSYVFSTTGRAQFSRKDTYEAEAPGGRPHRHRTVWTVAHVFKELRVAAAALRLDGAALRKWVALILRAEAPSGDVDDRLARADFLPEHRGDGLARRGKVLLLDG